MNKSQESIEFVYILSYTKNNITEKDENYEYKKIFFRHAEKR